MVHWMNASFENIRHPGLIEQVDSNRILVKILSQSACSTCHAKGMCNVAEVEEKIVEVQNDHTHTWKPGMEVTVLMSRSLGSRAVFLGYVLPLIVLVGSLVLFVAVIGNEGLAALISLVLTVVYYAILYLFRDNLKKKFNFSIEIPEE